jgi:hypothetical protein
MPIESIATVTRMNTSARRDCMTESLPRRDPAAAPS